MPLPPFIKSPTFLTGFGTVGSGAIGIGGWQIYEDAYPTVHRSLSRQGFRWNPTIPELKADVSSITGSASGQEKYQLESYGCFRTFFPGASVNQSEASDTSFTDPVKSEGVDLNSSFSNPTGCALMNLSYEWKDTPNAESLYVFKAEITVKNDKFGWALWAASKRTYSSPEAKIYSDTSYYLLFLKKADEGINWSILGGYSWSDGGASATSYLLAQLRISIPGGQNWADVIRNHKDKTVKKLESYSGIWEVSENGKEIFQDIEVWYGNANQRSQSAEILGREFTSGGSSIDFSSGGEILKIHATYGYKENAGWVKFNNSSGKDVGSTLNTFYAPWSGKKGTWTDIRVYCKKNSYRRDITGWELEKFKSFCYSKQGD